MWPDRAHPNPVSDLLTIGIAEPDLAALRDVFDTRRYRLVAADTLDDARQRLLAQACNAIFIGQDTCGIDGFEALRLLRRNPATRDVPIFFFATRCGPELDALAQAAGATSVLRMPPVHAQLQRVVDELHRANRHRVSAPPFFSATGPDLERRPVAASHEGASTVPAPLAASTAVVVAGGGRADIVSTQLVVADGTASGALSRLQSTPLSEQLDDGMRKVSQGLLVQFNEIKSTVAQLASERGEGLVESRRMQSELRTGLDETHRALRLVTSRIDGIERELLSQLTEMRSQLDAALRSYGERVSDLGQQARQAAAEEAKMVAEQTVTSAALRISDQLADAILGAVRR